METTHEMEKAKIKQQEIKLGKLQRLNKYVESYESEKTRDGSHRILVSEENYKLIREAVEEYIRFTFCDIQKRKSALESGNLFGEDHEGTGKAIKLSLELKELGLCSDAIDDLYTIEDIMKSISSWIEEVESIMKEYLDMEEDN